MIGTERQADILMYHSISLGEAPICISPRIFCNQMAILADYGRYAISLREYIAWLRGEQHLRDGFVVLTFDDGYEDFAVEAYDELAVRSWKCTVFVPAGRVGSTADWNRGSNGALKLMNSETIAGLARAGVEIGAHGITHRDLTGLSPPEAREEIVDSKSLLRQITGAAVTSFAPPYGRSNLDVREMISHFYLCSVGTELRRARHDGDVFDLPRIDMWYFRNLVRWQAFLRGGLRASAYLAVRRMLRRIRALAAG